MNDFVAGSLAALLALVVGGVLAEWHWRSRACADERDGEARSSAESPD